ncbi:MAG: hypothetical protein AAGK09_02560 [Planctomycetota bacterium]
MGRYTSLKPVSNITVQEVEQLLNSSALRDVQEPAAKVAGIKVLPHRYAAEYQSFLRFIQWDMSTIYSLLETRKHELIRFTIAVIEQPIDVVSDQEYPEGEAPDPDDNDSAGANLGIENGFALRCLAYFVCLDRGETKFLGDYLKLLRIPHAAAFRRELQQHYKAATADG